MTLTEIVRTVRINKGATLHGVTGLPVTTGFVVSPYKECEHKVALLTEAKVAVFQYKHKALLRQSGHCLGFWVNADDGMTYCDVVVVLADKVQAAALAVRHDQIAFWDLDRCEEVRP